MRVSSCQYAPTTLSRRWAVGGRRAPVRPHHKEASMPHGVWRIALGRMPRLPAGGGSAQHGCASDAGRSSLSVGPGADQSLEPFRTMVRDKLFTCTMCGKCCTGEGEVSMTDGRHMAARRGSGP
eukprot:359660-Chlamydomonas_euryale.AAC.20